MSFFVTLTSGQGKILINPDYIAMCEERSAATLITLRTGEKISVHESVSRIAKLCESLLQ
jgi:uncharacterized protein YlzI (FlbEa/FlbD family)